MQNRAWIEPLTIVLVAGVAGYVWFSFHARADGGWRVTDSPQAGKSPVQPAKTPAAAAGVPAFQEARDFLTMLDSAKLEDLSALWASLPEEKTQAGFPDAPSPRQIMVMERWAELDAPGALEFAKQQKTKLFLVAAVFAVWGEMQPDLAMAAMREEKDREVQAAEAVGWLQSANGEPIAIIAKATQLTWLDASKLRKEDLLYQLPLEFLEKLHAADALGLKNLASWLPPWFGELLEVLV